MLIVSKDPVPKLLSPIYTRREYVGHSLDVRGVQLGWHFEGMLHLQSLRHKCIGGPKDAKSGLLKYHTPLLHILTLKQLGSDRDTLKRLRRIIGDGSWDTHIARHSYGDPGQVLRRPMVRRITPGLTLSRLRSQGSV